MTSYNMFKNNDVPPPPSLEQDNTGTTKNIDQHDDPRTTTQMKATTFVGVVVLGIMGFVAYHNNTPSRMSMATITEIGGADSTTSFFRMADVVRAEEEEEDSMYFYGEKGDKGGYYGGYGGKGGKGGYYAGGFGGGFVGGFGDYGGGGKGGKGGYYEVSKGGGSSVSLFGENVGAEDEEEEDGVYGGYGGKGGKGGYYGRVSLFGGNIGAAAEEEDGVYGYYGGKRGKGSKGGVGSISLFGGNDYQFKRYLGDDDDDSYYGGKGGKGGKGSKGYPKKCDDDVPPM